jgi:hypothetical protein
MGLGGNGEKDGRTSTERSESHSDERAAMGLLGIDNGALPSVLLRISGIRKRKEPMESNSENGKVEGIQWGYLAGKGRGEGCVYE